MSKSLEECRQNLINDNDDNEKDLTKTMKTKKKLMFSVEIFLGESLVKFGKYVRQLEEKN